MPSPPFPHPFRPTGPLIRHDTALGHAFEPGVERRVPHEHGAYFARTNAEGFREDVDLAALSVGGHIQCYGDSYAAGDGVDNGERFTALVARRLGEPVANVAVPGHGPDQNVLQLEQRRAPRPRLILWCIAVQTIERIQSADRLIVDRAGRLQRVGRPHFVLDERAEPQLRGVPVPENGDRMIEPPCPQVRSPFVAQAASLAAALRARVVRALAPLVKPPPDPDYRDPRSAGWQLLRALVRRFHAAADGVPVVIVPLPTSRYVAEGRPAVFQERFAELARPNDRLHVLDVVSALRRLPAEERAGCHYHLDGHFTARGHVAVADALVEQLRAHQLVIAPAAPGAAERPSKERGSARLRVGWQLDDGFAEVRGSDGSRIAWARESELTGQSCRAGVVPLSAVNAVLERARLVGSALGAVELVAPTAIEKVAAMPGDDVRRARLIEGLVRWGGAAVLDLRRFLGYPGAFAFTALDHATGRIIEQGDDDELQWLRTRTGRLANVRDGATLERLVHRLAKRWELATRAAREAVLPTTAPLRRGRMAHRVRSAGVLVDGDSKDRP